ncbi:hypothetical protein F5Y06DRAFT_63792 [Hypoxylon sp. FL0890]|nr:hypothetical protein F5Y06DRAFT_63792 [Hypoxylon sp. FL0890]
MHGYAMLILGLGGLGALASEFPATIFQGNSIIMTPSSSSRYPGDAHFRASNFYCYATAQGYLSFGWWLSGDARKIDHGRCGARPQSFDWFEYSIEGDCTLAECKVTAVNYHMSAPDKPAFKERYVARMLDVGAGDLGNLALSYFDKEGGGFAVGTRRVLSGHVEGGSATDAKECNEAFQTLTELQKERNLSLNFTLENPCTSQGSMERFAEFGTQDQNVLSEL